MDANFNFDNLFTKNFNISFEDKEIFKKAALMYDFDLQKDFTDFSATDIELLKTKVFEKIDGKYALPDSLRKNIIKDKIGLKNIANEIKKKGIETDFSKTLLRVLENPTINPKSLSTTELFYANKILDLLPKQINTAKIQSELQRRHFFIPFQKITENFAGREKELDTISEYVDWLPKKGAKNVLLNLFRNVINWHDKPPMLIQGIGGVGKSTLISKFILDQNNDRNGKKLPFIYIDFDLPGFTLKEPLNILIESLRQLSIQFVAQQALFKEVSNRVTEMIYKQDDSNFGLETFQSTTQSTRGFIYDDIQQIIDEYNLDLNKISTPILIIFDSFEEMQYRASRSELNSFFEFIKEISEKIPRIRPVFVGRAEISERLGDFEFDKVELTEFDQESAMVLLQKYGIDEIKLGQKIYDTFGGNPLLLQLAADLVKKDKDSIKDFEQIKNKKHEYLIYRILDHIHDPDVRKIAVPGMLVRSITPEVIREILAVPCQLGMITTEKSQQLFDELRKETALISKSSDDESIAFRQDLRMACEKMIWEKYPEASQQIRHRAVEFYSTRTVSTNEEADEAEYYYHLLKKGEIPKSFTKKVYERISIYLESSIKELPEKAQIYIASFSGSRVATDEVLHANIEEFEAYYLPQLKRGLNSELGYLQHLYREINSRSERSDLLDSEFAFYEALMCQRLNKLNESDKIIDKKLQLINFNKDFPYFTHLQLLKIQNLEYKGLYKEAFDSIKNLKATITNDFQEFKWKVLHQRLQKRVKNIDEPFMPIFGNPTDDEWVDTNWAYIGRVITKVSPQMVTVPFKTIEEFEQAHKILKDNVDDYQLLEQSAYSLLHVFIKDITMTGELPILIQDYLYAVEVEGKLEELQNPTNTKRR